MDINICQRKVIFEKFSKLNLLKERFYSSVIESQKKSMNDDFLDCISEMIYSEFKISNGLHYITKEYIGDFFHLAYSGCIKGLKNYRNHFDCNRCYIYFSIIIRNSTQS
jgi:hypothetical protein